MVKILRSAAFIITNQLNKWIRRQSINVPLVRNVSLFSGRGVGVGGYQVFKQGSHKFLTLPLNTNKKIVTLPTSIQSYFLKHYCP